MHANYCYRYGAIRLNKKLANYRIEINESLKIETINGFIENDYNFRKYLIKLLNLKKSYTKKSLILKEIRISDSYNYYNIDKNIKNKYKFHKTFFKLREVFCDIFN